MLFPRIGAGVLVAATMQGFGFSWFAAHQVAKMRPLQLVRIEEIPTLRRACEQNAKCYLGKVLDDTSLCHRDWNQHSPLVCEIMAQPLSVQPYHVTSMSPHFVSSKLFVLVWSKRPVFESDAMGFLSIGTSTPCCIGMLDRLRHIPQGHCQAANRWSLR